MYGILIRLLLDCKCCPSCTDCHRRNLDRDRIDSKPFVVSLCLYSIYNTIVRIQSSLLRIASTYWHMCQIFKLRAWNFIEKQSLCERLTRRDEIVQLRKQCEDEQLLPIESIVKFPFDVRQFDMKLKTVE